MKTIENDATTPRTLTPTCNESDKFPSGLSLLASSATLV